MLSVGGSNNQLHDSMSFVDSYLEGSNRQSAL